MRGAVTTWVAIGFFSALLAQVAVEILWIFALVPALAWAFAGLVLLLVAAWRARKAEGRMRNLLFVMVVVVGWLLFVPIARMGGTLTHRIRFSLARATYDAVVARETASEPSTAPASGSRTTEDLVYVVDAGPPTRIAFVWPGGILDNWCGAVYDPTSLVLRSTVFDGERATGHEQVPVEIRKLFGGDLLSCRELDPPYYHCCST